MRKHPSRNTSTSTANQAQTTPQNKTAQLTYKTIFRHKHDQALLHLIREKIDRQKHQNEQIPNTPLIESRQQKQPI